MAYTYSLARMRLDEISGYLAGRMQTITSRTGVNFSMMFARAVTSAVQPESAEEPAEPETAGVNAAEPDIEPAPIKTSSPVVLSPVGKEAYEELITKIANQYGLDPSLIMAVVQAESSFNPNAVSPKGAMGLMQLMPATAEGLGVTDAFDPAQNIDGGVRCLLGNIIRYDGDVLMALAAYNCGPYGLSSRGITDLRDPEQRARLPRETQRYLDNIAGILEAMGCGGLLEENYFA